MDITFSAPDVFADFLGNKKPVRKRLSVAALVEYDQVGEDLLVHKATQDLWALRDDGTIERLFEEGGEPLKV